MADDYAFRHTDESLVAPVVRGVRHAFVGDQVRLEFFVDDMNGEKDRDFVVVRTVMLDSVAAIGLMEGLKSRYNLPPDMQG